MNNDIRAICRPLVPKWLYRACSRWADECATLIAENLTTVWMLKRRGGDSVTLRLKSLKYPFTIQTKPEHVRELVGNVFRRQYDKHLGDLRPKTIIDAGCFIGELAAHWATKWPGARIVSLEPNNENYSFAEANLSPYGDQVKVIKMALWATDEKLKVLGSQNSSSVELSVDGAFDVCGISILSLMKQANFDSIDLLKLDIEGAEFAIFENSSDTWLPFVRCIILEFHDPQREPGVWRKLESQGFHGRRYRSVVTFQRA